MSTRQSRRTRSSLLLPSAIPESDSLSKEVQQGQDESYLSAATLPPNRQYRIISARAAGSPPSQAHNEHELFIQGQEYLSDGWRRDEHLERRLCNLRQKLKSKRTIRFPDTGEALGIEEDYILPPMRRRLGRGDGEEISKQKDGSLGETLWYTAELAFPCSCQLHPWPKRYKPSYPPPITSQLHPLPIDADISAQTPQIGNHLKSWSDDLDTTDLDPALDDLEEFEITWKTADGSWGRGWLFEVPTEDVEMQAGPSKPRLGTVRLSSGDYDYSFKERDNIEQETAAAPFEEEEEEDSLTILKNRRYKGKGKGKSKAIDLNPTTNTSTPPAVLDIHLDKRRRLQEATLINDPIQDNPLQIIPPKTLLSWQEESKRRKDWWRKCITSDKGYGRIWNIIPLPHTLPILQRGQSPHPKINLTRPTDFILSKILVMTRSDDLQTKDETKLQQNQHPYHPDIMQYIKTKPKVRVYWLIPINGPVLIPGYNDPPDLKSTPEIDNLGDDHHAKDVFKTYTDETLGGISTNSILRVDKPAIRIPLPSQATFLLEGDNTQTISLSSTRTKVKIRPAPLIWTSKLLIHWYKSFLLPLYFDPTQPLGQISISISGPKPDPWIDLPSPAPLVSHINRDTTRKQDIAQGVSPRPVRIEAGDHIRLYCNLEDSLALRSWLYGIEYDAEKFTSSLVPHNERKGTREETEFELEKKKVKQRRMVKMFDKVRLALVGPRQEVLLVA